MRTALTFAVGLAGVSALLLAGCGSGKDAAVNIVAIGSPDAPFEKGVRLSAIARTVRGATVEGLVGFDEQAQVIPAMADRWIVTDDGLSYIFRLRDGTWPDGSDLTAQSARAALREAIAGLNGTPLALDLSGIEDIRAMTGRVIEIRLSAAMPNLLQLLAQPELGLVWRSHGSGPMQLKRDQSTAILTALPPEKRGLPAVRDWALQARPLRLLALPGEAAVARFNAGEAEVLLGGRFETFPLARSVGLMRGTIQLDPVIGLFGLAVVRQDGFLAAPENREAIAMAIDRDALIAPLGLGGWRSTTRVVAPGVEDDSGAVAERWPAMSIEDRRTQASARVSRWRKAQPARAQASTSAAADLPRLRIALPDGPGATVVFEQLLADFKAIGLDAVRVGIDAPADLRLVDVVARYPRMLWFLNQLNCTAGRGTCSDEADRLAASASRATDPAVRANLLGDAEAELTKANVFIPLGAPIRWSLVRGDAAGFAPNRWGVHPLMPLALRPR